MPYHNHRKGVGGQVAATGCAIVFIVLIQILCYLALLAGAVWIVVKVLQHLGVL